MPETPDYRRLNVSSLAFPVTDLGELAARLGSIDTFDRRGDVVFLEDFESGRERWNPATSGAGATVELSLERVRSGLLACHLVAGSDSNRSASIGRTFSLAAASLVGIEASLFHTTQTEALRWAIVYRNGSRIYVFQLRWRESEQDLQVLASNGSMTTVAAGVPLTPGSSSYATMKLVVDLVNLRYQRAILNRVGVDISAHEPEDQGATTDDYTLVALAHIGDSGSNAEAWVDDVIVTQNEPL